MDSMKEQAVALRRSGHSYREILAKVPVAKSTLSLWLRGVGLSKRQQQRLSEKRKAGALRGAQARRMGREVVSATIKNSAAKEIGLLTRRERLLIGAALYWAEGSKEKSYKSGVGLIFTNSDPGMVKFYVHWLKESLCVPASTIQFSLYLHETKRAELEAIKRFWTSHLSVSSGSLSLVYFKRNRIGTRRKNTGSLYYGTMRVKVSRSSHLNRRVSGWIEGVVNSK